MCFQTQGKFFVAGTIYLQTGRHLGDLLQFFWDLVACAIIACQKSVLMAHAIESGYEPLNLDHF